MITKIPSFSRRGKRGGSRRSLHFSNCYARKNSGPTTPGGLSKKGVIPHLMRDLPSLKQAGDAGSESGMTKLRTNIFLSRPFWTASTSSSSYINRDPLLPSIYQRFSLFGYLNSYLFFGEVAEGLIEFFCFPKQFGFAGFWKPGCAIERPERFFDVELM